MTVADPLPSDQSGIETFLSKQTIQSFAQTLLSCVIGTYMTNCIPNLTGSSRKRTVSCRYYNRKHTRLEYLSRVSQRCGTFRSRTRISVQLEYLDLLSYSFINRLSHISLALLYASLTKLFLLSLLVIWKPAATGISTKEPTNDGLEAIFHIFDDNRLNREWLLRNLMGGMASGFAVRGELYYSRMFLRSD